MKSCDYIKGKLGLVDYSDKDVFAGYPIITLEGINYITDKVEQQIKKDSENIKYRVITHCIPSRV